MSMWKNLLKIHGWTIAADICKSVWTHMTSLRVFFENSSAPVRLKLKNSIDLIRTVALSLGWWQIEQAEDVNVPGCTKKYNLCCTSENTLLTSAEVLSIHTVHKVVDTRNLSIHGEVWKANELRMHRKLTRKWAVQQLLLWSTKQCNKNGYINVSS